MRVAYHTNPYISHRTAAAEYRACLAALGHEVMTGLERLDDADVVILHEEPTVYDELYTRWPVLRSKRVIACCVWENETLAGAFQKPLGRVDAVWTPSHFSASSMLPHCSRVHVLPHVVRRSAFSREDAAWAKERIQADPGVFVFFSIIDAVNPRKNVEGLLTAFQKARNALGGRARLVLKQYRLAFDFSAVPGVVSITEEASAGQMAALHALCGAYVSAHHAEGWGLGLSEAMAFGRPVIATGYSGNMDFMDESNSFPVPYTMAPVSALMCERIPLFTRDMRWAEPDLNAMADCMVRVARGRIPEGLRERAASVAVRFGPEAIADRLARLLEHFHFENAPSPGVYTAGRANEA